MRRFPDAGFCGTYAALVKYRKVSVVGPLRGLSRVADIYALLLSLRSVLGAMLRNFVIETQDVAPVMKDTDSGLFQGWASCDRIAAVPCCA